MSTLDGTLGITGGMPMAQALVGPDARIGVTASLHGGDATLSRLTLAGSGVRLRATGSRIAGKLDATADATLSDLHAIQPTLSGQATLHAHAAGSMDDLAAQLRLAGDIATKGVPKGHVEATRRCHRTAGRAGRPRAGVGDAGRRAGQPRRGGCRARDGRGDEP